MEPTMNLETQLKADIIDLENKLLEANPMMPQLLAKIHKDLANQPSLVQSLSDEDIAIITKGLSTYTKTEIVTSKKKAPAIKASKITVDDLL